MALRKISGRTEDKARLAQRPRVLYVEDEDTNWEVAEHALRGGYDLMRARNAQETFAALERERFDLVLMDIQLSGSDLSGIDITKVLRGMPLARAATYDGVRLPTTPIVFVTAYGSLYSREHLLAAGGTDMVAKPVCFPAMSLLMSRLIARRVQATL